MFSSNSTADYMPSDYRISGRKLETILGPLEARVMEIVWEMKTPVSVRMVYEKLRKERKIAYTTVMSTMNTLFEKGLLDRKIVRGRGGLLYVYWPKLSKEEVERSVVKQVIDSLMRNFGNSVTSYLVEITASDKEKLKVFKKLFESLEREG
ncbi:BlaI/MecI/CopY family transcriptional regulator [Candidatus Bathyarchaeota archaeon]|nr:MAG: BlaI/MecI/CopY family transcriptional regulator [Candidatus Bathyarchaeota archaeon]